MRKSWLWLVPLLLVTFWLGVHYMDARPVWVDELYSLRDAGDASRTPAEIWSTVATENPWHPPGFFILLNGWERLVGLTPPALRLLSLLCGLLTVALTYVLGRDTVSERVGLYGAILLGTTVMFSFYLNQIRVYVLLTLLSTFTLWIYLRVVRAKNPRPRDWLLLLLGGTGILYSHYFGGIVLGAIGLYHLLFVPKNRRWWTIVGVFALGGLLFLPWVDVLREALDRFSSEQAYNARALTNAEVIEALAALFSNGMVPLLIVVLALALIARLRGGWRMWFFAATILISLLAVNAVIRVIPMTRLRYLLMIWPIGALVAATGLAWLGQRGTIGQWASVALVLIWGGAGIVNVDNPALIQGLGGGSSHFPLHRLVHALDGQVTDADMLVSFWPAADYPNHHIINYYRDQIPSDQVLVSAALGEVHDVDLEKLVKHDRIWLAYAPAEPIGVPESFDEVQSTLSDFYQCRQVVDQPDLRLELYARAPVCCGPSEQSLARFGDGSIVLSGLNTVDVDDGLNVTIGWAVAPTVPGNVYSVTLQVFDAAGNKVGQGDYSLPARAYSCATTSLDVSTLASGQYEVRAGVYTWETGERLPGQSAGGETGDLIPVSTITVP